MKALIPIIAGVLMILLASCASTQVKPNYNFEPTAEDMLTEKELNALVWHAGQFVSKAKRLRLTPAHREIIRTTKPESRIHYLGRKYGTIHIEWTVEPGRVVLLSGEGDLTRETFPWQVEIKITQEKNSPSAAGKTKR